MTSAEVIRIIKAAGWVLVRTKGSHRHFAHSTEPGIVTVPHPKKDIPTGTLKSIEKQAGIRFGREEAKKMHYDAFISREGKYILAEFPDCPGCQTFAESSAELAIAAREALEGWLEAHLVGREVPPRPSAHSRARVGSKLARVPVRAGLAAALGVRWARHEAGLTQGALGKLAGVTQQQIAKLENPDENPSLDTLEKIAKALGRGVDVALESSVRLPVPPAPRRRAVGGHR